jgi:alkaline phosphatase D
MSGHKSQPTAIDRRRFLEYVWRAAGASLGMALLPGRHAFAAPRLGQNPFTLGVASGDPTPDGIVLWTRLAPAPAEPERLGAAPIRVGWRVARDAAMRHVVARGTAAAPAELAHSVHVEVRGLLPHRDYFYQFDVRGEESAIGHFRTAPRAHELLGELRFAFATCQDWDSGYYTAYRDMSRHDLDLVLHLGDYTYEYGIEKPSRRGGVPAGFAAGCCDLRTYRLRHALYKLDPDLQAAHAAFPFAVIWDDHDVANDYSGLAPNEESQVETFVQRRAAAYQAYYEHLPIRASVARLPRSEMRIYRRLRYGALAEFTLLDDRQYRSARPCGGGDELVRCEEALHGDYSMLGHEQEAWLARGLVRSSARWNLIAQQLLVAELEYTPREHDLYWNDAWDAYPLARRRLLSEVVRAELRNPVFLTGDWHSTFVNDIKLDFKDRRAPAIATEFVTPAISTGGDGTPYGPLYSPMIPYNPHIKYYEGDRHGYFKATLTPLRMQVDLRFVTSVEDPNGVVYSERSFAVEDGVPGAQDAHEVAPGPDRVAQRPRAAGSASHTACDEVRSSCAVVPDRSD